MYEKLVTDLRKRAHELPERFSKNSLNIHLFLTAADVIEILLKDLEASRDYESFWRQEAEEALRRFQVAVASKPQWIPVTERLPVCSDTVICFGDGGIEIADFVIGDKWSALPWFFTDGEKETGVTHWMPLPEPPKEGE